MLISNQRQRFVQFYNEYPGQFWLLMLASFIDRLGGAVVATFMALYVTQKFDVGLTAVGGMFAIFSITGLIGSFIGGALTDKLGRKGIIIFSLVMSATSSLSLGFIDNLSTLYGVLFIVGLLSETGGPAVGAMIADLLPEEKRAEGYSIARVTLNMAWIVAPILGGLLIANSYELIFIFDAITSCIMAGFIFYFLKETKPQTEDKDEPAQSLAATFQGYRLVLRDFMFLLFIGINILVQLVYLQMYSTLPVFLRDVHGVPGQHYGYLMSANAGIVILFQFWISRKARTYPPLLMLALGCLFYVVGFGMYGFVSVFPLFLIAMVFATFGEMITFPVGQSVVAQMAPEDKRGRYMALYGFSFAIPSMFGTWLAGVIMENGDPNWVWYLAGIGSMIAALAYTTLYRYTLASRPEVAVPLPEPA